MSKKSNKKPQPKKPPKPGSMDWFKNRGRLVKILMAGLALVMAANAVLFLLLSGDSGKKEAVSKAREVVKDSKAEDFQPLVKNVDTSENDLLSLLIAEGTEQAPEMVRTNAIRGNLQANPAFAGFVTGFFGAINEVLAGTEEKVQAVNVSDENTVVILTYSKNGLPLPVMMVKKKDGWKLDLNSLVIILNTVMSDKVTSQYIIDTVNSLLSNPTRFRTEKAISILKAAQKLKPKYENWLRAKDLLSQQSVDLLKKGLAGTEQFDSLMAKSQEAYQLALQRDPPVESDPNNPGTITKSEFDRLEKGMTYEDAKSTVGGDGTVVSESGETVIYGWEQDGQKGYIVANAIFENGQLVEKTDFGITQ